MRFVEPSAFVSNAIGRIPASILMVRTIRSVAASTMEIVLLAIDPATANLPSGVTYTLCTSPATGTVAMRFSEDVSMTSSAPGASRMPTYTFRPSFVMSTLFGRPLSGTRATTDRLSASTTSSV